MTRQAQGWAQPGIGQAVVRLPFAPTELWEDGREPYGRFLVPGLKTI